MAAPNRLVNEVYVQNIVNQRAFQPDRNKRFSNAIMGAWPKEASVGLICIENVGVRMLLMQWQEFLEIETETDS
jgi:hypothetical protein